MTKTHSVKINRKDLYKENYTTNEYSHSISTEKVVISKSIVDIFIKMIKEYA